MIKLTFYSKDKKRIFGTREVKIPPNGLVIGRGKNCNIQVEDPTVSRQHAVIYFKNNNYYIKDLKSENGTFVNDKKVDETILKPNDVIGIGKYLVEFTILSPETVGVSPSILYPIIAIFGVLAILLIVFFAKPTSTLTGLLKIDSDPQGAEVLINN
ncbi:MAG TPA: FHA domain-containing protein, partial [Caldisericia bacterium]|nr:FHA domain-containing protein [Caldisericia bacterium]HPP44049.1 FHA domain-containing protein [Caldisericia bacterium]